MLKLEICLAWLIFMCGHVLLWRRRDNIFGYLQGGFFFASILFPVVATRIIDQSDPAVVTRYAHMMLLGAAAHLAGLFYGAPFGRRQRLPRLSVGHRFERMSVPSWLVRRSRLAGTVGLGSLGLSFVLLGYVPLLAADRVSAKYGIGIYRPRLSAALLFHIALLLGAAILPVILALVWRRRQAIDLFLAGGLGLGLLLTLSRSRTFTGPLVFLVALLIARRWRPWRIVSIVCFTYVFAAFANEVVGVAHPTASVSFSTRVASSAPEISDHLGFLNGFEITGNQHVGLRTIVAGLSPEKGEYGPSTYALRIRTGLSDLSDLAAGGIRLPAPIWGYAAYGYVGVMAWSFISGVFTGYGTVFVRRLLAPVRGHAGQALNLILAWVFFEGTFGVAAEFFYPERVGLVAFALALFLAVPPADRSSPDVVPEHPGETAGHQHSAAPT